MRRWLARWRRGLRGVRAAGRVFVVGLIVILAAGLGDSPPTGAALAAPVTDPLDPADAPAPVRRAVFRAETAAGAGETDRAARILAEALADGHDHPALRHRLGTYRLSLGDAPGALPHLRRAAEALSPGESTTGAEALYRDLGRAEYETGHHARAARAFTEAHAVAVRHHETAEDRAHAPASELIYYSAVAWSLAGEASRAVDQLAPLVRAAPDTVPQDWVQALVSFAAQAEEPGAATAGVARLLRDHPDRPSAWRLASEHSQLAGRLEEAAVRLQVAHWLRPLAGTDRQRLAELHAAAGAPRKAARVYAEMLAGEAAGEVAGERTVPRDLSLARALAVSWIQAHEPDSARVVLRSALTGEVAGEAGGREVSGTADSVDVTADGVGDGTTGDTTELLALLADLEYGERNWAAAADALRRLADRDPDRGRAWLLLGASELQLGDHDTARAALRRALDHPEVADQARRLLDQVPSG